MYISIWLLIILIVFTCWIAFCVTKSNEPKSHNIKPKWHRALDNDLPKENELVLIWCKHTGYSISFYKKSTYPSDFISGNIECNIFSSNHGFLTDEDVYWSELPTPPTNKD